MLLLLRFCSVENSVLTSSAEEASASAAATAAAVAAATRGTARLGVRRTAAAAAVKIIWFTRTGAAAAQPR